MLRSVTQMQGAVTSDGFARFRVGQLGNEGKFMDALGMLHATSLEVIRLRTYHQRKNTNFFGMVARTS